MTRELTPSLTTVLNAIIDKHLADIHTSLPAEIISYDYDKNLAVVRPLLKRKYKTEEAAIIMPTISSVPVAFQRMGPAHLRLPINPGDTGQLVFVERSIDGWLISGGAVDPLDPRKHSLSDAVFYPGLNPNNNPIVSLADQKSIELKLKNAWIEITDDGRFKITNNVEELFDLLVQTFGKMIDEMTEQGEVDTTHTIWGPLQPNNFFNYQLLKIQYQQLKTKMETLKG